MKHYYEMTHGESQGHMSSDVACMIPIYLGPIISKIAGATDYYNGAQAPIGNGTLDIKWSCARLRHWSFDHKGRGLGPDWMHIS